MVDGVEVVTIDGPSGVGKSTISRRLSHHLGFTYLDTGAMYRAVAWYVNRHGIDADNEAQLTDNLDKISITLIPAHLPGEDTGVIVNGEHLGAELRTPEISMLASRISALPPVRRCLTLMQQEMGKQGKVVAEGRDTGTVVFPDAAYKFFLDASPEVRAKRRIGQLQANGETISFDEVLAATIQRDRQDRERSIAPLRPADDALRIDTSTATIDEVVDRMLGVIAAGPTL
ncbi:MAG: (d)CMP kinase [Desulfofustis sp. PB-SRB1]|jgi:cytidylate kinase|nr:(d)CMP kinase [Desulfofustis sp. PB-SRB1]MBM1001638.1 (d)CMP kinase [Desulfofustis sp. PB-SRB1]HBH28769.1 (d)CMP kinase [Desulfofustis sp.]HBH32498.1 (d)CMP kinase [Desulfofustis sp.]